MGVVVRGRRGPVRPDAANVVRGRRTRERLLHAARERILAEGFEALQQRYPAIDMGSYPFYRAGRFGTSLVLRGTDPASLDTAAAELTALVRKLGAEPVAETV